MPTMTMQIAPSRNLPAPMVGARRPMPPRQPPAAKAPPPGVPKAEVASARAVAGQARGQAATLAREVKSKQAEAAQAARASARALEDARKLATAAQKTGNQATKRAAGAKLIENRGQARKAVVAEVKAAKAAVATTFSVAAAQRAERGAKLAEDAKKLRKTGRVHEAVAVEQKSIQMQEQAKNLSRQGRAVQTAKVPVPLPSELTREHIERVARVFDVRTKATKTMKTPHEMRWEAARRAAATFYGGGALGGGLGAIEVGSDLDMAIGAFRLPSGVATMQLIKPAANAGTQQLLNTVAAQTGLKPNVLREALKESGKIVDQAAKDGGSGGGATKEKSKVGFWLLVAAGVVGAVAVVPAALRASGVLGCAECDFFGFGEDVPEAA